MNEGRTSPRRLTIVYVAAALVVLVLVAVCAVYLGGGSDGGKPVPGHPDWRMVTLPIRYENGSAIEIIENWQATDPSGELLQSFLNDYTAPQGEYDLGQVCSSYAVDLHDTAERMGIKAHVILLYFVGVVDPHAIVAFDTTDGGRIYVDSTGLTPQERAMGYMARFRIAEVVAGEPYVLHYTTPYNATEATGQIIDRVSVLG